MLQILLVLAAASAPPPSPPSSPASPPAPAAAVVEAPPPAPPAALSQTDKIRVVTLSPEGAPPELGAALSSIMAQALSDLGPFAAVGQAELSSMLDFEAQKQTLGCAEGVSCIAEIIGAMGADYIIAGRLVAADELFVLQLQLIETGKAQVLARESRDVQGKAALFETARGAVRVLVQGLLEGRAGTLVVVTSEPGATVTIDRRTVGVSPLEAQTIGAGAHNVTAEKEGFIAASLDVDVKQGETTTATLKLRPSPQYRAEYESNAWNVRIASFALGGAGVLAGAAGGGLLYLAWSSAQEVATRTDAYNAAADRPQAEFDAIRSARQTVGGLEAGALGAVAGAVVLGGAGLVAFLVGPDPGRYAEKGE